ncbi:DNA primase [Lutibacter profundi]|uniref:DNA primase n=1 Tax=Lutibacter profundi TaxID=1622118 RepID=A0A0X8G7E4_9FLAO|nr:tetratricopeptide repeat protein [Lutibacter profundi]AMC11404.1 DNA primase [Lutibacter profundi]
MKNILFIVFLCLTTVIFSQEKTSKKLEREARKEIREGNKLYNQLNFKEAEIAYKKGLSKNKNYPKAMYNLGNAIYQQDRFKEAINQFELAEKTVKNKMDKAEAFHNMGNSFMKEKQYGKAVEAFKNALRNNSKDDETRYNLALAQELLKQQQQQNKNNKDKNKDKNNKDKNNKDKKDNKEGDKDKKDDKNKDKDKGKDKKDKKGDEKKNKDKKQNKDKQQQKPRPNQLSPEQMRQLLEAMNNEENKTQKKLNAKKAKGRKIKQEKDW